MKKTQSIDPNRDKSLLTLSASTIRLLMEGALLLLRRLSDATVAIYVE